LSAKKRIRQNLKRRAHNKWRKGQIREQGKVVTAAMTGGDLEKSAAELNKLVKIMDKVASKNTIHKNAAARKRSRLTRRLNALRAGGGKAAGAGGASGGGTKAAKA
jgi:small subunit ribosomal protein S20